MKNEIHISNIGPIVSATIPIPSEGGVVVLRGINGSGKTHAIDAVKRLEGEDVSLPLRDGTTRGTIDGCGVKITVSGRTVRNGELTVGHIEGADPSLLVDPGISDPEAADAERIRQLCEFAKVTADPSKFHEIFGDEKQMLVMVKPDSLKKKTLPDMASALKRDCESYARKLNDESLNLFGQATALIGVDKVDDLAPRDVKRAQEQQTSALRAYDAAVAAHNNAASRREEYEKARKDLDDAKTAYTGGNSNDIQCDVDASQTEIARLKDLLTKEQTRLSTLNAQLNAAHEHEKFVNKCESILGTPVPVADSGEVDRLKTALDEANNAVQLAIHTADILDRQARGRAMQREAEQKRERATHWREAGKKCTDLVQNELSRVAPQGMTVEEGRLLITHPERGRIFFSELSLGQRNRLAMHIALEAAGTGCLIPMRQEFWEGLDPENRAGVAEQAREHKSTIITAEASDGPLRAEKYK